MFSLRLAPFRLPQPSSQAGGGFLFAAGGVRVQRGNVVCLYDEMNK